MIRSTVSEVKADDGNREWTALRVLMLHSAYRELGGEEISANVEASLLAKAGHEVELVELDELQRGSLPHAGTQVLLGSRSRTAIEAFKPDVVHIQNFFPLVPPSVFRAARRHGAATVQTLRNYRTVCLAGTQYRDGGPCTECAGSKLGMASVRHRCYRDSALTSVLGQVALHRYAAQDAWTHGVDAFIAVSPHVRAALASRIPVDRIEVKPNTTTLVDIPGDGAGGYALAVGRLSEEKGLLRLAETWAEHQNLPMLKIVGDGDHREAIHQISEQVDNVALLGGLLSQREIMHVLRDAALTIVPSRWREPFGRIAIESLSAGTPVLWNHVEGVEPPGGTGPHLQTFELETTGDLADRVTSMLAAPQAHVRSEARRVFDDLFSPEQNLRDLERIYQIAIERSQIAQQA